MRFSEADVKKRECVTRDCYIKPTEGIIMYRIVRDNATFSFRVSPHFAGKRLTPTL